MLIRDVTYCLAILCTIAVPITAEVSVWAKRERQTQVTHKLGA